VRCLLCDLPAIADCLCVPCGAKLWAVLVTDLMHDAAQMPPEWQQERAKAMKEVRHVPTRVDFLARLDAARAARDAKNAAFDRKDVS
jgi:hypothetical protein